MAILNEYVEALEELGLLDVLLPFLLIFTIAFAVLQKSKVLGEHSKNFNSVISFVLAMTAIIPHITGKGPDVVKVINDALPDVSLLMIACMMALILLGVFGKDVNIAGTGVEGWVVIFSFVAVAWTFASSAGIVQEISWLSNPETRSMLIAILVFGIIVWFITKEEMPQDKRQSVGETINKMFGGVLGKK